jgi:hypothetical protein
MIGAVAAVLTIVTWGQYLWRIPRERIPRRPWGSLIFTGLAVGLGAFSGSWWGWAAALVAAYFWFLTFTSTYPSPTGIGVGDRFPAIVADSSTGTEMRSSEWNGRRTLFKLYRGPW